MHRSRPAALLAIALALTLAACTAGDPAPVQAGTGTGWTGDFRMTGVPVVADGDEG